MASYQRPELPAHIVVHDLVPEHMTGVPLTPETPVTCLNRSGRSMIDKFDGRDYLIPPGYFQASYGAAVHFQQRNILRGTRNPDYPDGKAVSLIAILGIDRPERCTVIPEEVIRKADELPEAIVRVGRINADDEQVTAVSIDNVFAAMPGGGAGGNLRPVIDLSRQATEAATAAAETALKPLDAGQNDALAEMAEAAAGGATEAPAQRRARK